MKDDFVQRTFRVVREFEGGQRLYGFQGLCMRGKEGGRTLLLMGGDDGKMTPQNAKLEHCECVDSLRLRKPSPLFGFTHVSFEKKLHLLGRCGITDVEASTPFEKVLKGLKPEGCHTYPDQYYYFD